MWLKKYRVFIGDVSLNVISNIAVIGMIQLCIFPVLSRSMNTAEFGVIIALYGFSNMLVGALGDSLSNMRLLYNDKIKEKGNFTSLLLLVLMITILVSFLLNIIYGKEMTFLENFLIILFTLLGAVRAYTYSYFRVLLEYQKIVYANFFLIIGYILGLLMAFYTNVWSLVFLFGELFACLYIVKETPILKEKPKITHSFKLLLNEYKSLATSRTISTSLNYLDRFLITPILGAQNLSIYYSVSVVSKMISLVMTPTTNVFLSYLNKFQTNKLKKVILLTNIVTIIILMPMYAFINWVSPYIIGILYPQFSDYSEPYIWIVTLASCFLILGNIINPFLLKYCKMKYQMYIQVIYGVTYLSTAILMSNKFGLIGFCISSALSLFIKWVLMLIVSLKYSENTLIVNNILTEKNE